MSRAWARVVPLTAPTLTPLMTSNHTPFSPIRCSHAPTCQLPLTPPPDNTRALCIRSEIGNQHNAFARVAVGSALFKCRRDPAHGPRLDHGRNLDISRQDPIENVGIMFRRTPPGAADFR